MLGGFLFGAVMIAAFGIAIEAVPSRRIKPLGLTVATLLAFALAGSIHIWRDYPVNAEVYAPREAIVKITRAEPGGIGGEALWRPAAMGIRPRYESAEMERYLAGQFTRRNERS